MQSPDFDFIDPAPIAPEYRTRCALMTLSGLAGWVVPVIGFFVPLILWIAWKDEHPILDQVGRENTNFALSYIIFHLIAFVLWIVLIGVVFTAILTVLQTILMIVAAVKYSNGENYRYPVIFRFV